MVITADHLASSLGQSIRRVIGDAPRVGLHEPEFAGNEWAYVKECIDTAWVSSVGAYVDRFEAMLAQRCAVEHVVATVNGTAALHAALLAAGVGRNDEVLVPTLTFVATANAVKHAGAIPHFIDSNEATLGVDPQALREYLQASTSRRDGHTVNRASGRRIAAVVPVHIFGHPVDMAALNEVAQAFELVVVEDATESLGSTVEGRPVGGDGLLGTLSFNGNKIITTGGGGAILCRDEALAARVRSLCTTAKQAHPWAFVHDQVAFNYRLPNLNAALGCAQLERLDDMVRRKRLLAERYAAALEPVAGVSFVRERAGTRSNYWLNALMLDAALAPQRDAVLGGLHEQGLLCRPAWTPMHELDIYADCPRAPVPCAESLAARIINLPSSPALAESGT